MALTSYEVVRRAIEFKAPDRLPLRYVGSSAAPSDVHEVPWNFVGTGDRCQRQTYDEWGCLWVRSDVDNMGQVKAHPLSDWAALQHYRWPDPDRPESYDGMEERFAGAQGKYVITGIFMLLFERMWALHGFENTLADLYLQRQRIERLADRIVEFDLGIISNLAQRFLGQIHGFWCTDDWGTQQALMIRPSLWMEFFRPRYARIFDAAHEAGWHVWMHSDGMITPILGPLIDSGVDVIQLVQPRLLGIERVGQEFRGRVCFESLCDIQRTLPVADVEQIRAEARLLLDQFAAPEGGFVLTVDESDARDLGYADKIRTMLQAFAELDPWRRQ